MERRFLNKSWIHGFLIFISSLVSPCAAMEYNTPIERYVQVWVFPFGAYFQEFGIGGHPASSKFVMLFSQRYLFLFSITEVVLSVMIGLIFAKEIITLQQSTDLPKKIYLFTVLLLLYSIQVAFAIDVVLGGSWIMINYIFPLPIPLLIAILLLKYKGFRFMRESYFQGFLVIISSLMLPFAVIGFESNRQEWLFPFGVCHLIFNEHIVWTRFFMPFFLENWFAYFNILAMIWVVIGLFLAAEVIKLWESKELTRKAFSISIILLTLEIGCPIILGFLMYNWSFDIKYIIPLPIPFLVVILLLKHGGVTITPIMDLRRN